MAYTTWTSSYAGYVLWKSGLPLSKHPFQRQAGQGGNQAENGTKGAAADLEQLWREIDAQMPGDFSKALFSEVQNRLSALLRGVEAYRVHPYRRQLPDPPVCWREGSARMLDYGAGVAGADGTPVLIVPSLVNRSYILDLTEQRSLTRWLAQQGFRPYLIDWGTPDESERSFSLTDYVAGYLKRALDSLLQQTAGRPPVMMGYCMGGLLALALAQRRQKDIAGLALLATPWDFHAAGRGASADQLALAIEAYLPLASQLGSLPVDALQSLFACLDPMAVTRKFLGFSKLDPAGKAARNFVALEDWINDGVPLAAPVARECLEAWYLQNRPARNAWKIAGRAIVPGELDLPCLGVVPLQDRIVPPASAMALCGALNSVEVIRPRSGHIGMVVGQRAARELWEPLGRWLKDLKS
jgi:polyhydroxyalkanoate synthase